MLTGAELLQREGESRVNPELKMCVGTRLSTHEETRSCVPVGGAEGESVSRTVRIAVIATKSLSERSHLAGWLAGGVCVPGLLGLRAPAPERKSAPECRFLSRDAWDLSNTHSRLEIRKKRAVPPAQPQLGPSCPVHRSDPPDSLVPSSDSPFQDTTHVRRCSRTPVRLPPPPTTPIQKKETLIGSFPSDNQEANANKKCLPPLPPLKELEEDSVEVPLEELVEDEDEDDEEPRRMRTSLGEFYLGFEEAASRKCKE